MSPANAACHLTRIKSGEARNGRGALALKATTPVGQYQRVAMTARAVLQRQDGRALMDHARVVQQQQ